MPSPNWHEDVRRALVLRRLPPAQVERLLLEIHDHYLDLMEEDANMSTDVLHDRLGAPEHIANFAASILPSRSFAWRHPILTFLVAPIPLAIGIIVAFCAALIGASVLIPNEFVHNESGIAFVSAALLTVAWIIRLVPFAILAFLFSRAAGRTGHGWKWGLAACALLAALAGALDVNYRLPTEAPNSGAFMLGLGYPLGVIQFIQFVIPLAIGLWFVARNNARQPASA